MEAAPDPHEGKFKAPADGPAVLDNDDDGWPGYEEPVFVYHYTPEAGEIPHRLPQEQSVIKPGQIPSFKCSAFKPAPDSDPGTTRHKTKLQRTTHDCDHHGAAPWWFLSSPTKKSAQNGP